MNERYAERVLTMSAEAAEFADELGFSDQLGSTPGQGTGMGLGKGPGMGLGKGPGQGLGQGPGVCGGPALRGLRLSGGAGASPLVHWSAMAAAAAIVLAAGVWFAVTKQPAGGSGGLATPVAAKAERAAAVLALAEEPNVNMVVALFREDDKPNDECPACWCVTQWHEDWGTGRDITKVLGDELLAASKERRCVARPQQMIVVGLSGPASAMPASDELARQLALCLAEKQDDPSPRERLGAGYKLGTAQPSCLPVGVDYRLATWTR